MLLLTTYSAFSVGGNLWGLAFPPHSGQRGADRQHTECKPEVSSGTKDAQHYHGLNFLNQTRGLSPLFSSCWTSTTLHLGFGPLQERHQMEESSLHAHFGRGNHKSGGRILPFLERRIAGIQEHSMLENPMADLQFCHSIRRSQMKSHPKIQPIGKKILLLKVHLVSCTSCTRLEYPEDQWNKSTKYF